MRNFNKKESWYYCFNLSNKNLDVEIEKYLRLRKEYPDLEFIYLFNEEDLLASNIEEKILEKLNK